MTTNVHNYPWRDATPPDILAGRTTGSLRGCGYCGSMHPEDLAAALRSGARLDPADRKYGWPHKFYVDKVPNPHVGLLESRMGCSDAVPDCPNTGKPCEHGPQNFYHPRCECAVSAPDTIKTGKYGASDMLVIPTGRFHNQTGKPQMTWTAAGKPAPATTYGKFYTEHLQDSCAEDRGIIERHMGMHFEFLPDGSVRWRPYGT